MLLLALRLVLQVPDTLPAGDAPAAGRPTVTIPRIEARRPSTGVLDEPVWDQAGRLDGFSQYEPVDSRPAEERTDVLVWYAPDAIYFGILAYDHQPGAIRATRADRDNIDNDDNVTIYLDTFNDRRRAFFFAVNPLGIQEDGVRSEGATRRGRSSRAPSTRTRTTTTSRKGRLTDQGYVVEIRIPFKSLRFPGNGPQHWGINFLRRTQRTGYNDTWTDVRRANASFLVQAGAIDRPARPPPRRGGRGPAVRHRLGQRAPRPGHRDLPAGRTSGRRRASTSGSGSPTCRFDGTYNPDFSQVESDVEPGDGERAVRPVLPGEAAVLPGGDRAVQHAEPAGLHPADREPDRRRQGHGQGGRAGHRLPHRGGRERGRDVQGSPVQRHPGAPGLRQQLDRQGSPSPTAASCNRPTTTGCWRATCGTCSGNSTSWRDSWAGPGPGTRPARRSAPLWKLTWDRTGRSWGFNYSINAIGDGFETRSGFVPRNDIAQGHILNRLSFYGAPGALVENFTTFFGPSRIWRYDDLAGDADGGQRGGQRHPHPARAAGRSIPGSPATSWTSTPRRIPATWWTRGPAAPAVRAARAG